MWTSFVTGGYYILCLTYAKTCSRGNGNRGATILGFHQKNTLWSKCPPLRFACSGCVKFGTSLFYFDSISFPFGARACPTEYPLVPLPYGWPSVMLSLVGTWQCKSRCIPYFLPAVSCAYKQLRNLVSSTECRFITGSLIAQEVLMRASHVLSAHEPCPRVLFVFLSSRRGTH